MKFSLILCTAIAALACPALAEPVQLGVRPMFLVDQMKDSPLKDRLKSCEAGPFESTPFSFGHRGAPMQFPEHTRESYTAAGRMGAGVIECDVAFTKDKELVCRHAQNDLATTTNILATDLAAKCTAPFTPAKDNAPAGADCRTSDLTLAEFRTLKGKMDAGDKTATDVATFMDYSTPSWRTDLYAAQAGTLMTHAESIALIKSLGGKFTPELKKPVVDMPFEGFTQQAYAQKMIDEYKAAGIPPSDVWPQSFELDDILYWIKAEPEFGKQAVYLDDSDETVKGFDPMKPETWDHSMADLKTMGVNYIAPPIWMLLTVENGKIVPSAYAREAKKAGLKIITWSLERSGPLKSGGGYYYQSMKDVIDSDGMMYEVVDALAQDVGVSAIFSDWPATVTFYANCMGLK